MNYQIAKTISLVTSTSKAEDHTDVLSISEKYTTHSLVSKYHSVLPLSV